MENTTSTNRRRVRVWLAQNDKTQRWLADEIGLSETTISLALAGKRDLTDSIRDGVMRVTGIRLRDAKVAA